MKLESGLKLKSFCLANGERFCLLISRATGEPDYFTTLFITTQVRNGSLSVSSMMGYLNAINVGMSFFKKNKINLHQRVRENSFLSEYEIDALSDYCRHKFSGKSPSSHTPFTKKSPKPIDSKCMYVRMTYIAKYLSWYTRLLLGSPHNSLNQKKIDLMMTGLKARRPRVRKRRAHHKANGLTLQQVEILFDVFEVGSKANPFVGEANQFRNRLMFFMLFYLGIRRGELLNLQINDIDFRENELVIARRPDFKSDPRKDQPLVKTLDRRLPIKSTLVNDVHEYILRYRKNYGVAKKHSFLFVVHSSGPTSGRPLTKSAYDKIFARVRSIHPELASFSGHELRHHWNERFSELMDSQTPQLSEKEQEKYRSYLMGWKEGSGTAAVYNQRFIERKAVEAALQLQQRIGR